MSHKLLTVVCALALVLGLSLSASAAVQNVKVGGDIEVMGIYQNAYDIIDNVEIAGVTFYDNDPKSHDYLIQNVRLYVDASLTDNVEAYIRLIHNQDWGLNNFDPADDVEVDLAYLTLSEMYGYPFSLTIGRQEIREGEGFLVGDGIRDTVDSVNQTYQYDTRKSFDAIKATWDYSPHRIDLFVAKVTEGSNVNPFGFPLVGIAGPAPVDTDNDLYGIDWNYDGGVYGLWDFAVFYDRFNTVAAEGETHTLAASIRGEGTLPQVASGTLALKGEIVKEWGTVEPGVVIGTTGLFGTSTDNEALDAWAVYLEGEYTFDNPYAPYFGLGYIFMSGDNYNTDKVEQFNPLFEDETYGEIAEVLYGIGFNNAPGAGVAGLPSDTSITNASIWKASFGFNPTENTSIGLTYYNFFAPQEVFSVTGDEDDQDNDVGSEYDVTFTYNYTEDVSFGLMYALFVPGKYFEAGAEELAGVDVDLSNAQELLGSVKVTF